MFCDNSEKRTNNLRVTLFRIRNAFREAGVVKGKFLIRQDLSAEIADSVCDIMDFHRFIRNNLRINADNIGQAEKVVGFVNGDLLDDIDAPWVTEKREYVMARAEELYINMSIFYLSGGFSEQAEAALKYRCCYERYRKMAENEFGEYPPNINTEFYTKSTERI